MDAYAASVILFAPLEIVSREHGLQITLLVLMLVASRCIGS